MVITFAVMPGGGFGVALPVIEVPGEVVVYNFLPGFNLTNTLIATVLADILILAFAFGAWRVSKGWTQEVPNRFQAWVEILVETFYNFMRGLGGDRLRSAPLLWPLVATIFFFLITANLMKLLPGVEAVGTMHCAYPGQSGYFKAEGAVADTWTLYVPDPLFVGYTATYDTELECQRATYGGYAGPEGGRGELEEAAFTPQAELSEQVEVLAASLEAEGNAELSELVANTTHPATTLATNGASELELPDHVKPYIYAVTPYVRGAATDLSLTLALAIISIVTVQIYGVWALGPAYFEKFVALTSVGNASRNPIGVIDVIVGALEIISELSKIISLAFRLFGNLFAGGVLLMVMSFLVALLVPVIFYGLELIIVSVQALVFAVLTLVFSVQAMEAHHGDEEHAEHH
ncbi:MAG: F0F1 ATP synthase subunit A [Chloroflexi bacterium]|nr:F0F1 ATP synthase subunit A [Chloroflexota bacterium]